MRTTLASECGQHGLSYVEVLLAIVIVGLSAVPVGTALRTSMKAAEVDSLATVEHFHLMGKMEEVLSQPYGVLLAQAGSVSDATIFSDPGGTSMRRLVYISNYDGDNADADNNPFTGTDPELLWVRVETENGVGFKQALKYNQ